MASVPARWEGESLVIEDSDLATAIAAVTGISGQAAHVAAIATANATDLASSEALANANKVALNALIASLQAAGVLASS